MNNNITITIIKIIRRGIGNKYEVKMIKNISCNSNLTLYNIYVIFVWWVVIITSYNVNVLYIIALKGLMIISMKTWIIKKIML